MREIQFRGKSIRNGDWMHGSIFCDPDTKQVFITEFQYYRDENGLQREWDEQEVYADTVGQYTGLKDKNDTKIFEGDILTNGKYVLMQNGCWADNTGSPLGFLMSTENYEVIGNIHDDPQLIIEG